MLKVGSNAWWDPIDISHLFKKEAVRNLGFRFKGVQTKDGDFQVVSSRSFSSRTKHNILIIFRG